MALPPLTIFDIETTGLDARKGHRLVEIGGVRFENSEILRDRTFSSFVNPEREIPFEARQVNKISDDMVKDAPRIEEVLPKFLEFAAGTALVAHNAAFDFSFLEAEKEYCWGYVELPECFCTMKMSQYLHPQDFRHSLDVLTRKFNLQSPTMRHRALDDAILAAEVLQKMLATGRIRSLEDLRKCATVKQLVK